MGEKKREFTEDKQLKNRNKFPIGQDWVEKSHLEHSKYQSSQGRESTQNQKNEANSNAFCKER